MEPHSSRPPIAARVVASVTLLAGLLTLILHPGVPKLHRSLRSLLPADWTFFDDACRFGYLAHSGCYFAVAGFVLFLFRKSGPVVRRRLIAALLASGVASEVTQIAIPGRDFDPYDMLCNVGAIFTAAIAVRPRTAATAKVAVSERIRRKAA